jgi:hypothetical protein
MGNATAFMVQRFDKDSGHGGSPAGKGGDYKRPRGKFLRGRKSESPPSSSLQLAAEALMGHETVIYWQADLRARPLVSPITFLAFVSLSIDKGK